MTEPKRHHLVPEAYLQNFAFEGEKVGVLDKVTGTASTPTVKNTCVQNQYYKSTENIVLVHPEKGVSMMDPLFVEKTHLGAFEGDLTPCFSEFIEHISKTRTIHPDHKNRMSSHVAMMWLRSSRFRDRFGELPGRVADSMERSWKDTLMPDIVRHEIAKLRRLAGMDPKQGHISDMLSPSIMSMFSRSVHDRIWCVFENVLDVPFYTSDNPVVPLQDGVRLPMHTHIRAEGAELIFPLTPKFLLLCFCPVTQQRHRHMENMLLRVQRTTILEYNYIQYMNCERLLIVGAPDFDIARDYYTFSSAELQNKYGFRP